MIRIPTKLLSFEEYLAYDDGLEHRYELLDTGELIEVPLENQANIMLAMALRRYLEQFVSWHLFRMGNTAIEVAPLTTELADGRRKRIRQRSRIPDLMILSDQGAEQISGSYRGLALTHDNPLLVVEVVSESNADEDYVSKRLQYAARGIGEYWILDRHKEQVVVFVLEGCDYLEQVFRGSSLLRSAVFPQISLTADDILTVRQP